MNQIGVVKPPLPQFMSSANKITTLSPTTQSNSNGNLLPIKSEITTTAEPIAEDVTTPAISKVTLNQKILDILNRIRKGRVRTTAKPDLAKEKMGLLRLTTVRPKPIVMYSTYSSQQVIDDEDADGEGTNLCELDITMCLHIYSICSI